MNPCVNMVVDGSRLVGGRPKDNLSPSGVWGLRVRPSRRANSKRSSGHERCGFEPRTCRIPKGPNTNVGTDIRVPYTTHPFHTHVNFAFKGDRTLSL